MTGTFLGGCFYHYGSAGSHSTGFLYQANEVHMTRGQQLLMEYRGKRQAQALSRALERYAPYFIGAGLVASAWGLWSGLSPRLYTEAEIERHALVMMNYWVQDISK